MAERTASNDADTQKRRSTRIVQAVPITVIGVDALGQPFKERTSSLIISCHGCKYQSKHYVPKNAQVTLEIPRPKADQLPRTVRGRIVWVQRPRTIRELFQIGIEFQSPGNVWGIAFPPADWLRVPEDAAAPSIPAPEAERVERGPIPPSAPSADSFASNKIRLVPDESSTTPAQLSMTFARQMARMLADAKQALQQTVQESASAAVEEASRGAHLQLEAQIRHTIDKTLQSALVQIQARTSERPFENFAPSQPRELSEPSPEWLRAAEQDLRTIANQVTAHLSEVTEAQRAALRVHAERIVEQARQQAGEYYGRFQADAVAAQEQLAQSRQEIEAAAASIRSEGSQSLTAFRNELAQRVTEARDSAEALDTARARAESAASQISGSADSIIAEAERRIDRLLNDRDSALRLRAQELIAERVQEIQPDLESMAQQVVARLADQANQRLAPQIDLAQTVASQLTESRHSTEEYIAGIQQRLTEVSEQTLKESRERLQQHLAQYP
ncbi:MAG: PilZ domain-containing protein, partial [Candidatus Acidiferrales bacterium]